MQIMAAKYFSLYKKDERALNRNEWPTDRLPTCSSTFVTHIYTERAIQSEKMKNREGKKRSQLSSPWLLCAAASLRIKRKKVQVPEKSTGVCRARCHP
jgi:hypothetical protein